MESSAKGEGIKSVLRWDCEKLRALIKNHERLSVVQQLLMKLLLSMKNLKMNNYITFQKLKGVNDVRLVDPNDVYDYICNICPLPFSAKVLLQKYYILKIKGNR